MNPFLKKILNRTWKPCVQWYLRKDRRFRHKHIDLIIRPGIFHPGLFYSTKYLLSFLEHIPIENKQVLEIGCGSGMVSIFAAKKGGRVTATDINSNSIGCAEANAVRNHVDIRFICSDLFTDIPLQMFDLILINPPFYKRDPRSMEEQAWFAGEELQFFERFFSDAGKYLNRSGECYMVLSDDCDLRAIGAIAAKCRMKFELVHKQRNFVEKGFIYRISV